MRDIQVLDKKTNTSRYLYARPVPTPYSLAEVDRLAVPQPPTSGTTLRVKPDTGDLPADAAKKVGPLVRLVPAFAEE